MNITNNISWWDSLNFETYPPQFKERQWVINLFLQSRKPHNTVSPAGMRLALCAALFLAENGLCLVVVVLRLRSLSDEISSKDCNCQISYSVFWIQIKRIMLIKMTWSGYLSVWRFVLALVLEASFAHQIGLDVLAETHFGERGPPACMAPSATARNRTEC